MIDVIAFYPGGGGNRYIRYIAGLEYSQNNAVYDRQAPSQFFANRYLTNGVDTSKNIILTHCLNKEHIKSLIENCRITFLISDFKKSLHREWKLMGHARYTPNYDTIKIEHYNAVKDPSWPDVNTAEDLLTLPEHIKNEINTTYKQIDHLVNPDGEYQYLVTAFATISWHDNYYKTYPVDFGNSMIIDIDNNKSEFAKVMQRQLNIDIDPMFDLAWASYYKFGQDAKLTEIYENYKYQCS